MRDKALDLAVQWHKQWHGPSANHTADMVVDTAETFLLFLERETKNSQPIKNPTAKGQPR